MYFFFQIENIRFHGYDKNCHCQLQGGVESTEVIKSCDQALRIREEPRILCDRAEAQLAEVSLDLTDGKSLFIQPICLQFFSQLFVYFFHRTYSTRL